MLYAWCRHCDDVVDGQSHGFGSGAPGADQACLAQRPGAVAAHHAGVAAAS
ncbi:hypothetical protein [Azotobacter armeniacus]